MTKLIGFGIIPPNALCDLKSTQAGWCNNIYSTGSITPDPEIVRCTEAIINT